MTLLTFRTFIVCSYWDWQQSRQSLDPNTNNSLLNPKSNFYTFQKGRTSYVKIFYSSKKNYDLCCLYDSLHHTTTCLSLNS